MSGSSVCWRGVVPVFELPGSAGPGANLDRRGNLDEALASLPAARAALRSDHSILLAQADELEARIRMALGDRGAPAPSPAVYLMTAGLSSRSSWRLAVTG